VCVNVWILENILSCPNSKKVQLFSGNFFFLLEQKEVEVKNGVVPQMSNILRGSGKKY